MKFCKKYEEYMEVQCQKKKLPGVGLKKLKKILKSCRNEVSAHNFEGNASAPGCNSSCTLECPVCEGTFFPSLLKEMSAVVGSFNDRARRLLELHLSHGLRKCFICFVDKLKGDKMKGDPAALVQEGKDLVTYAIINAIAMRKILKKYDKIHYSKQGQAFKSQAHSLHIEILQSPWLCELMAFHINLREAKVKSKKAPPNLFEGCSLVFEDEKPTLCCELFDLIKLQIDLTCSVCLDTVFDPVALTCGHIFCYMCACKAGSVTIVDGLKSASCKQRCPLCRESGVYERAIHLEELNILLSRSCPEYWSERLRSERQERVKQAKEHWENLSRAFTGI